VFKATKVDTGEIVAIKKVLQDKRFKVVPRGALFSSTTAQCQQRLQRNALVSGDHRSFVGDHRARVEWSTSARGGPPTLWPMISSSSGVCRTVSCRS